MITAGNMTLNHPYMYQAGNPISLSASYLFLCHTQLPEPSPDPQSLAGRMPLKHHPYCPASWTFFGPVKETNTALSLEDAGSMLQSHCHHPGLPLQGHQSLLAMMMDVIYGDNATNPCRQNLTPQSIQLANTEIVIDKLHMAGHTDTWCRQHFDPKSFKELDNVSYIVWSDITVQT